MKGGEVIGAGGFGCAFKPALLCKGQKERMPNTISKLMSSHRADDEFDEVAKIAPYLKKIPNYENYFIATQIKGCYLEQPTPEDLENYDTMCRPLIKKGITKAVLQNEIAKKRLIALQLPFGGDDLEKIFKIPADYESWILLINTLEDLYLNGIIPMNKLGVIHNDVKAQNIVYNYRTDKARLIDWGLSYVIRTSTSYPPPYKLSFMFNQPLTSILFYYKGGFKEWESKNNYIIKELFKKFVDADGDPRYQKLSELYKIEDIETKKRKLLVSIYRWLDESIFASEEQIEKVMGPNAFGHLPYIFTQYFDTEQLQGKPPDLSKLKELFNLISSQIALVLLEFSYNEEENKLGEFDIVKYYQTVFRHNVDVYGLISVLQPLKLNKSLDKEIKASITAIQDELMFSSNVITNPYKPEDILNAFSLVRDLLTKSSIAEKQKDKPAGGSNKTRRKKANRNRKKGTIRRKKRHRYHKKK